MKRFMEILAFAALFFAVTACGSSMERDANNVAKRAYEMEQMAKRMGDRSNLRGKRMSEQEYQQHASEYIKYANKMMEKYGETPEQRREFNELVEKKLNELKGR